jgi:hypothetical protein
MKRVKPFMSALAIGALLATPIAWACNKASNDTSRCATGDRCQDTDPVYDASKTPAWTCAPQSTIADIKKTCVGAGDEVSTCNDADAKIDCKQTTTCKVVIETDPVTGQTTHKCAADVASGTPTKELPKVTGTGC